MRPWIDPKTEPLTVLMTGMTDNRFYKQQSQRQYSITGPNRNELVSLWVFQNKTNIRKIVTEYNFAEEGGVSEFLIYIFVRMFVFKRQHYNFKTNFGQICYKNYFSVRTEKGAACFSKCHVR
jgi:hypothetical protein